MLITPELATKATALILVMVGALVEKNYVGRIATFSNGMAINFFLLTTPLVLGGIEEAVLTLYALGGLILGVIALLSYRNFQLGGKFYMLTWAYSSFVTGILILLL